MPGHRPRPIIASCTTPLNVSAWIGSLFERARQEAGGLGTRVALTSPVITLPPVTLIRVFKEARRWTVDCEGAATLLPSRRTALQSALDLAATIAPAVVLVLTTDGRVRLTIPVATGAADSTRASSDDLVRVPCSRRQGRPESGGRSAGYMRVDRRSSAGEQP
jgi:hypothetical protein